MAFFKKLKDKLFKSSSKLEEGLDAIVSDGGEVEAVEALTPPAERVADREPKPVSEPDTAAEVGLAEEPESAVLPEPEPEPEP